MDPTTERLLADVEAGLRVLQTRDGVRLDEAQIRERARNIVMGLVGNFRIESLDAVDEQARRAERERADSAFPDHGA
jgi:hypothetical protein